VLVLDEVVSVAHDAPARRDEREEALSGSEESREIALGVRDIQPVELVLLQEGAPRLESEPRGEFHTEDAGGAEQGVVDTVMAEAQLGRRPGEPTAQSQPHGRVDDLRRRDTNRRQRDENQRSEREE
jgi:hypothetical protein